MKNFIIFCFCLFVLFGFSFAKERELNNFPALEKSQYTTLSSRVPLLRQKIQENIKLRKNTKNSCFSWKTLLLRDNLSSKIQQASKKNLKLIDLTDKLGYDNKKIVDITQNLQSLWDQIAKDCSLSDFQEHRQQARELLDLLKIEISSLKKYIANLRNK